MLNIPDISLPTRNGTRSFLSLIVLLVGYAVAGFGTLLLIDGSIKVASIVLDKSVFVSATSVSQDFVVSLSVVAGGFLLFFVGRFLALYATNTRGFLSKE